MPPDTLEVSLSNTMATQSNTAANTTNDVSTPDFVSHDNASANTAATSVAPSPQPVFTNGPPEKNTHNQLTQHHNGPERVTGETRGKEADGGDEAVLVGSKVSEGHRDFIMVYNMLTGIRVAASTCSDVKKPLKNKDFKGSRKLKFSVTGNRLTPPSTFNFKFKDYAPNVFRELRDMFQLDPADYLVSLTAKYILSELSSPGKSGSFFFFSRNYKFIIKTISRKEHVTLRSSLKKYYEHVQSNPNTLVSQYYGLHRITMSLRDSAHKKKIYLVVMNNLFPAEKEMHRTYDLKGSLWNREAIVDSSNDDMAGGPTLKDQNWLHRNEKIRLSPNTKDNLARQLERDVAFLQKANIMDYSLLVGIHDAQIENKKKKKKKKKKKREELVTRRSSDQCIESKIKNSVSELAIDNLNVNKIKSITDNGPPPQVQEKHAFDKPGYFYNYEHGLRSAADDKTPGSVIYYLGIIDCLTSYSVAKKTETFARSFYQNRHEISGVPAVEYGKRFLDFMEGSLE